MPVANVMVVQITGIAIMNVCLLILCIVMIPILIYMFPTAFDQSNPENKQRLGDQREQERQNENGGYYGGTSAPNGYSNYSQPTYAAAPAYTAQPTYVAAPAYTVDPTYAAAPAYTADQTYAAAPYAVYQ